MSRNWGQKQDISNNIYKFEKFILIYSFQVIPCIIFFLFSYGIPYIILVGNNCDNHIYKTLHGEFDECFGKEEPILQVFRLIVSIHPFAFLFV